MPDLEYTHHADDIASRATWTLVSGTAATQYPLANLFTDDPSFPFKANETTVRFEGDFGVPVSPLLAVLVNPNFTPGLLGVMLEGSADAFATTPFSQEFPAASYWENDFPLNLHLDLRVAAPSYRYWAVEVTVANGVTLSIGEFILATDIKVLQGSLIIDDGVSEDEDHPQNEHATDAGIYTINSHGTWIRKLRGVVKQDDANSTKIRAWNRSSFGRAKPCVLLPHLDPEHVEYVRFGSTKLTRTYIGGMYRSRFELEFERLSVGLKPTPSAV